MKIRSPSRGIGAVAAGALLILAAAFVGRFLARRLPLSGGASEAASGAAEATAARPNPLSGLTWPTGRRLDRADAGAFQPTASGRPESALYGSVRTARIGGALRPSFHEGVDIAPLRRDRQGRPLDAIYAAMSGTVAYVNTVAGNSSYGRYVVLTHDGPSGTIYTLYAHLACIAPGLRRGAELAAGAPLGVMGASASYAIPLSRAHLHFEIGLILNARFDRWFDERKFKDGHGVFTGWNLAGVDPLGVYEGRRADEAYDLLADLAGRPPAFEAALAAARTPDFFTRYPGLWRGAPYDGGGLWVAASENGVPLAGRNATGEERARLAGKQAAVLRADPAVLGRNGCRLVVAAAGGGWRLGAQGLRWQDILLY